MRRRIFLGASGLALALSLGAWMPFAGGLAPLIHYISATLIDTAANSFIANNCMFTATGTIPASGTNQITAINVNLSQIPVGSLVTEYSGGYGNGTYIPYGSLVSAVSGSNGNVTLTLSSQFLTSPASATNVTFTVVPPEPASEWTWLPSATTNQPQNALSDPNTGAIAGTSNGTNQITVTNANGVNIQAGEYVTGNFIPATVAIPTVLSYSGGVITLSASVLNASGAGTFMVQPTQPLITQYRNSAQGTAATAQFTGTISGTTLSVSAVASGTISPPVPLYDAAGNILTGTYVVSQLTGTTGGVGTYQVSQAQSIPTAETMQAMGVATTYTSFLAAWPLPRTTRNYKSGDVFLVSPAVYFDEYAWISPVEDTYCGSSGASYTAGSPYVSFTSACPFSGAVGDNISDSNGAFTLDMNAVIVAVNPTGCTAPCIEANQNAVSTQSATADGFFSYPPINNVSVEGLTQNVSGVPTRPVMAGDSNLTASSNAPNQFVFMGVNGYVGGFTGTFLWDNIDVTVLPGTVIYNGGFTGLFGVIGPLLNGTITLSNSRIYDALNDADPGGLYVGTDGIIAGDDLFGPINALSGTLNLNGLIVCDNGGQNTSLNHNVYIGTQRNLTVNARNSYFCAAAMGHEFKTRADTNNFYGDYFQGTLPPMVGGPNFTGSISGNVLTVTAMGTNSNLIGQSTSTNVTTNDPFRLLQGSGIPAGVYIDKQLTTSDTTNYPDGGGPGTYVLSYVFPSPVPASGTEAMTASEPGGDDYNLDISCGGAATIENSIFVKNMSGPGENGMQLNYSAEDTMGVAIESTAESSGTTLNLTGSVSFMAAGDRVFDVTNPLAIASGTTISSVGTNSLTLSKAIGLNGVGVQANDIIEAGYSNCLWPDGYAGSGIPRSLTVRNNDFVEFSPTYDGNNNNAPIRVFAPSYVNGSEPSILPGDTGYPDPWSAQDNLFAGTCPNTIGQDTGGIPANQSLWFGNFPWYGTQATGTGASVGIQVAMGLTELSQAFVPGTLYAVAGDVGNVGALAYRHMAIQGLTRAIANIGAQD
jgi:hypothetical protein